MSGKTNVQFVTEIMQNPLAQIFVLQAIDQYAISVTNADLSDWHDEGMISKEAWKSLAAEITEKIRTRNVT